MANKKKQRWKLGDVFAIPTMDGRLVPGQIIGREAEVLNSVTIALFDQQVDHVSKIDTADLAEVMVFSVLFVTRDLLDSGVWSIAANRPIRIPQDKFPYEEKRECGFIGAKVIGSAIVTKFVNAYFGLAPWDDWKDPNYLDKLLISPEKKPTGIILKSGGRGGRSEDDPVRG